MTRINCIPPSELTDKHLVAEYRELPRVFGLVRKAIARGERPDDPRNPTEYTLGKGHVRFFYPRLAWCRLRFFSLLDEMWVRGFNPNHIECPSWFIHDDWFKDWQPTPEAQTINRRRIVDNIAAAAARKAAP